MHLLSLSKHPADDFLDQTINKREGGSLAGLIALTGLFLFAPLVEGGTTHQAVMVIRLLVLLACGLYLAGCVRSGAIVLPRLSVAPAVLAFLGVALGSTLWSPYRHQSIQWLLVLSSYAALLYLVAVLMKTWRHVAWIVAILCAVGLGEAAWVLTQGGWFGAVRPSGTFFNPNFVAGYCAASWTLLLGVLCYRKGLWTCRGTNAARGAALSLGLAGALVLLLVAVLWTESRGGALALLSGTALVLALRFGWKALAVSLLVLVVGILAPNPVRDRVVSEHVGNPVGYARWGIWRGSIEAAVTHPLGVGLGLYQYVSPRYMFPVDGQLMRYGRVAQTAHNEYLQLAVELGLAGLATFLWGLVALGCEARRALHTRLRRWQRGLLVGLCGAVGSVLVHAGVDANLHTPALAVLLTACVALILSARRLAGAVRDPVRVFPVRRGMAMGLIGMLLLGSAAVHVVTLGKAWAAYEAGSEAMDQGDIPRAIREYRAATELDPGKALYHSSLAAAHFRKFQHTQSLTDANASLGELLRARAMNPLDGRLYGLLGHLYVTLARMPVEPRDRQEPGDTRRASLLRDAREVYAQAIELQPYSPFYRLELGKLMWASGDIEAAQTILREAIDLEPNFLAARAWLGRLYLATGRRDLAEGELRQVRERQQRYAGRPRNRIEASLLDVDRVSFENAFRAGGTGRS